MIPDSPYSPAHPGSPSTPHQLAVGGHPGPRMTARERPHVCPRDACARRFASRSRLMSHLRRVHSGSGRVFCPYEACGRSFVSAAVLRIHVYRHTGERPFVCPFEGCGKAFNNPGTLSAHQFVHRRISPFVCSYEGCGRGFRNRHTLKVHEYMHRDYRPRACPWEGCTSRFRTRIDLARHRRVHTGEKPFLCSRLGCRKAFSLRGNLVQHQTIHFSTASFHCPHESCPRRFRNRKSVKRHMAVHLEAQLFACRVRERGKALAPPSGNRMHWARYSADKPHLCPVEGCVRRFARRDDLNWHSCTHARQDLFVGGKRRSMVEFPVPPRVPAGLATCSFDRFAGASGAYPKAESPQTPKLEPGACAAVLPAQALMPESGSAVCSGTGVVAFPRWRENKTVARRYGVEAVYGPAAGRRPPGDRSARPGVCYVSVIRCAANPVLQGGEDVNAG